MFYVISYDEQIRMFKGSIPIGPKGVDELVLMLQSEVDIEEIDIRSTPGQTMRNAIFNAKHCVHNSDLQITLENMEFSTFKVTRNKKSEIYYQNILEASEYVYVIFEKITGYFTSNSNILFRKIELARGVSQQEYDTEGPQFQSLISHLAIAYCEKSNC